MSESAPLRRWQIVPRQWHVFLGRHTQTWRQSAPEVQGWVAYAVECSCGCAWTVIR